MRLAELITKSKEETGLSFQAMSDKARKAGYEVNRATMHALTRDGELNQWPHPDTLSGLAVALDLPVSTVLDAAAESLGIEVDRRDTDTDNVRSWLALTGNRSQAEVEHLLNVARTVAAGLDETNEQSLKM